MPVMRGLAVPLPLIALFGVTLVLGCHMMSGVGDYYIVVDDGGDGGAPAAQSGASSGTSTTATTGSVTTGSVTTGAGGELAQCDPKKCPGGDTDCRKRVCDGEECGTADIPVGTPCNDVPTGHACDGLGACVECTNDTHCPVGSSCKIFLCEAPGCGDIKENANETDVDCGGPDCSPCAPGQGCVVPVDCLSQLCVEKDKKWHCAACTMHSDCGMDRYCTLSDGICHPKKDLWQGCADDAECKSGNCTIIKVCF
ncbi:MAG: hypothetical protein EXR75_09585 [Myxococcales bacterium]|nr:hypothetical protein [Myxococcales bacterium]